LLPATEKEEAFRKKVFSGANKLDQYPSVEKKRRKQASKGK